jgi:hypothetical protein
MILFAAVLAAAFHIPAYAASEVESDSYIDPGYNFSSIKSLCLWPADLGILPDAVAFSLPVKIKYWIEEALSREERQNSLVVKSIEDAWRDVWFIYGPFDFGDPFESEKTSKTFYSHLDGACGAVLKTSVSIESERKWQEPRVETYWTTVSVSSRRPRRTRGGGMVMVEIERDIPVKRERVIPGYWYVVASSKCKMELYDTKNPDGRYIAAVNVSGSDSGKESEKQVIERMVKRVIDEGASVLLPGK